MFALRNIMQDQIISEFIFLTGLKFKISFLFVTMESIVYQFDTLYQDISLVGLNKKLSE